MRSASRSIGAVLALAVLPELTGCGGDKSQPPATPAPEASAAPSAPPEPAEEPLPPSPLDTQLPESVREDVLKPFLGDLDAMVKRRVVRIGVTYSRTFYFVDRGVQRGVAYDYGQLVEERLNKHFKLRSKNKVHVFFVPLPRDMLLAALLDGRVDLVAAQITVRPELEKLVDFTNPTRNYVRQILVTGPGTPAIASVDDLSGSLRPRAGRSTRVSGPQQELEAKGSPGRDSRAPLNLEDDDLLEW
jgi:ABC-type amino acid transport substrate-binding protein